MYSLSRIVTVVFISLGAFAAPAFGCAPTCEDAYEHYSKGEYKDAITLLRVLVAAENPCAQYWLGESYRLGRGVQKSAVKARRLYELAARNGFAQAKSRLSELRAKGA